MDSQDNNKKWQTSREAATRQARYMSLIERAKSVYLLLHKIEQETNKNLKIPNDSEFNLDSPTWSYANLSIKQRMQYNQENSWHKALHEMVSSQNDILSFIEHYEKSPPKDHATLASGMEDDFQRSTDGLKESSKMFLDRIEKDRYVDTNARITIERLKVMFKELNITTNLDIKFSPPHSGRGKGG